jgi:predicted PurR-regulated permease PerM
MQKLPLYAKGALFVIGLFFLVAALYITRSIIVPIVFAFIIAILLYPVVKFFVRMRINRIIAITLTIVLATASMAALGLLLASQINKVSEEWPSMAEKFAGVIQQSISWVSDKFNIPRHSVNEWIAKTRVELINASGAVFGQTLVNLGGMLVALFLIPVYIFMILFYQPILVEFIHRLFGPAQHGRVVKVINETKSVIQQYLVGLIIEAAIIAVMYIVALLILGIDYAILLGIIAAILNLIPYIGGIIGVGLPMMVALATKPSPLYAIYIMVVFYIIQLIDNNFIVPRIVGSKVKINALFLLIVVIAGNALWGIPGMFLSIPLLAIVKLIFDNIQGLEPLGFLLGDTMPPIFKIDKSLLPGLKKAKKRDDDQGTISH